MESEAKLKPDPKPFGLNPLPAMSKAPDAALPAGDGPRFLK